MSTLLLTSGGLEVEKEILKILPKKPGETKIAHIITATSPFKKAPWMIKEKQRMNELGFQVKDIDVTGKNESQLKSLLKDDDVIYVQGGDPFYLLKQVKLSGFDKVVKDLVKQGKIYIGVSAGSYIACPTIEMALWKKPRRPRYGLSKKEAAMNLVPFLVSVHYEPSQRYVIKAGSSTTNYSVRILTDKQALLVKNGHVTLVGDKKEIKLR